MNNSGEKGVELTILKSDKQGCISYEDFEKSIQSNTVIRNIHFVAL